MKNSKISFAFAVVLASISIGFSCAFERCILPVNAADEQPHVEPLLNKRQAGYNRTKVGGIEVISISDGAALFSFDKLLSNSTTEHLHELLAHNCEKPLFRVSVNSFLFKLGDKWTMVDAGSSELIGPNFGKDPESLKTFGVKPEEISDIYVTHIHPDHTGGLMNGDKKVFPNATVHVNKRELDYWMDQTKAVGMREPVKTFFKQAEDKVKPYVDAGQVKTFDDATQFTPQFRSIPAYGHTPGHTFYALEDGGEKLVFWGDMIHITGAQFEDPNLAVVFDCDSPAAIKTRQMTLADAASTGYLAAGAHLPFPGIGHVRKDGANFRWLPQPYINDVIEK